MTGPKRISAWPWEVNPQMGQWTADQQIVGEGAEYVHIDEVQALIAGAFEAAAQAAVDQERACSEWFSRTGRHANVYEQLPIVIDSIRALTPADAIASRDAADAAIRKRGEG